MGFLFGGKKKVSEAPQLETKQIPAMTSPVAVKAEEKAAVRGDGRPRTIGELKASGYKPVTIREEMRRNLIALIKAKKPIFNGIIGYDNTVIPQVENAVLSGQNIIFLGERGQAKSRVMRLLVGLLDEAIPVIRGCEINDNPLRADMQSPAGKK